MTSTATVAALNNALLFRCRALESLLQNLRGNLGMSQAALQGALAASSSFPKEVERSAADKLAQTTDADSKILFLKILLRHVDIVTDFVEEHLSHGTRPELSDSLASEIRSELDTLGLQNWSLCMSHGGPSNFVTTYGDIANKIYGALSVAQGKPQVPNYYALFKVPRTVGSGVLWRPVLLGHEVGHVAVSQHDSLALFDLGSKFDFTQASTLTNPKALDPNDPSSVTAGLYSIAQNWAVELLCDAISLRRFGPAAICALAEYLSCIDSLNSVSTTHPPGHLRIKLMEQELGAVSDPRIAETLRPWVEGTPTTFAFGAAWADYLASMFVANGQHLTTTVAALPGTAYNWAARVNRVHSITDDFVSGLPADVVSHQVGQLERADVADVVNAAWITQRESPETPYNRLAQKSLEDIHFLTRWIAAGGPVPSPVAQIEEVGASDSAILSPADVNSRLTSREKLQRLEVRPLLQHPAGSGVDLRLGSRFIVFKRRGIAAFDPLEDNLDPRLVQQSVELAPGETLVLHPNEIVLGATLEYLSLPIDLSAQVITRSSYGRLGLLTATAVQVHAGFKGCLTLELVNLSTIPITLTPGERIAQLVLWRSGSSTVAPGKYNCPIGPEFSKVRNDNEATVLRALRA